MSVLVIILSVLAAAGIAGSGVAVWLILRVTIDGKRVASAREEARVVLGQADEDKRKILLIAQEEALKLRNLGEQEIKEQRQELVRLERRFAQKEEQLERKTESLEGQKGRLAEKEIQVQRALNEADALKVQQIRALEEVSKLSVAEAREMVVLKGQEQAEHDLSRRYYELEKDFKVRADENARSIITLAINRLATDVVSETTTSTVSLPNDEMKGRLIGREGRNIRALEALTGVDIVIDDTPEVVTISCFDPVRREIAKLALQKLVTDGRIQPARIEDMVNRAHKDIEQTIWKAGEQATFDMAVTGLDPELIRYLGQLKYRYSYGENVLKHCIEVGLLAGMLAAEVGANVQLARVGGLLHDIGKALTHEVPGPHAEIGAELSAKYGVNQATCACIKEHHDDEHSSIESFLVAAADAISAARPGARKESLDQYVKRLRELEDAAVSFAGVERAFAIQAGREVRVMVKPGDLDDIQSAALARDIAKKVETELVFPGQIKVTVIRETRNSEYAR
ncbi:MAG TPA: ribonuclease Y [Dehalococcoidia bacterium]|nr:ribonuclease Y [Dehalococcoidia bacterium]